MGAIKRTKPIYIKFTSQKLNSLSLEKNWPKKETYYWKENGNGFGVRVSPRGKIAFVYGYKFKGEKRRFGIGKFPKMSLADAGVVHAEKRKLVTENGVDVCAVKSDEKRLKAQSPTVAAFCVTFVNDYCIGAEHLSGKRPEPRKRSWREDERILEQNVIPDLGKLKMADITTKDIRLVVNKVHNRGAGVMANRTLSCLSKMFAYAVSEEIVEENVCSRVKKKTAERSRERVLSHNEIKQLWVALDTAKGPFLQNRNNIIKWLLITGQRSAEVRQAEWGEITGGVWHIPSSKAKNKIAHTVPLSSMALEVLEWQRGFTGGQKYIFSGRRKGRGKGKSAVKAKDTKFGETCYHETNVNPIFRAIIEDFEWVRTSPHDLRRSLRTEMARLKVGPIVAEKVLNHKMPGIMGVYDQYSYDDEKAIALQKWSDCLEGIVFPERTKSNIIDLPLKKVAS